CRLGGLRARERIDGDHTVDSLDEREVGEIESAHLVDARGDDEESVTGDTARMLPQHRIGFGRSRAGEEVVGTEIADEAAVVGSDEGLFAGAEEASLAVLSDLFQCSGIGFDEHHGSSFGPGFLPSYNEYESL